MDSIINSEGLKLAYDLKIVDHSSPYLVILVHGTCVTRNSLFFPQLADGLRINSLRFDMQGNGDSEGEFKITSFDREVQDIKSVVDWSKSKGYKVLALIGHSKGGNEVLLYSSKYTDIPLIVPICARFNMNILPEFLNNLLPAIEAQGSAVAEFKDKQFLIDLEGIKERRALDMEKVINDVRSWVLVVHGDHDTITNVGDAHSIAGCLGKSLFEIRVIKGADHFFRESSEMIDVLNDFFEKALPLVTLRRLI